MSTYWHQLKCGFDSLKTLLKTTGTLSSQKKAFVSACIIRRTRIEFDDGSGFILFSPESRELRFSRPLLNPLEMTTVIFFFMYTYYTKKALPWYLSTHVQYNKIAFRISNFINHWWFFVRIHHRCIFYLSVE